MTAVIVSIPDRHITEPIQPIAHWFAARPDVTRVEVWEDDLEDDTFGVSVIEDGMKMTAYFRASEDGEGMSIVGDWIC